MAAKRSSASTSCLLALLVAIGASRARSACVVRTFDVVCVNQTLNVIRSSAPPESMIMNLTASDCWLLALPDLALPSHGALTSLTATRCQLAHVDRNALANLYWLVALDLSGNELESLHSTTFASNRRLRSLDLSNNRIKYLRSSLFAPTRWLTTLDVSSNGFDFVDFHFFGHVGHLRTFAVDSAAVVRITNRDSDSSSYDGARTISMRHNRLTAIGEDDFAQFVLLVALDLTDNQIETIDENAFRYLTRVERLRLTGNFIDAVPAGLFDAMARLTDLHLDDNLISTFDAAVYRPIRRLERLHLDDNVIEDVAETDGEEEGAADGRAPSSLLELDLGNNAVEALPARAFGAFARLRRLKLDRNQIESVDARAFDANRALELLDLSRNRIRSIPDGAFASLASLRALNVSLNGGAVALPDGAFGALASLRDLDLRSTCVDRTTFVPYAPLARLESLALGTGVDMGGGGARLDDLARLTIDGAECGAAVDTGEVFSLRALDTVVLRHADVNFSHAVGSGRVDAPRIGVTRLTVDRCALVAGLPATAFAAMRDLVELRLSYTDVGPALDPRQFRSLADLRVLVLHVCGLETIADYLFYDLVSLVELDLSGNAIADVDGVDFSRLPSLAALSLRWNNISSLPDGMLADGFVESVDVSMNALAHVADDFFDGASLARFEFYGNPWSCACLDDVYDDVFLYEIEYETFGFLDGKLPACLVGDAPECDRDADAVTPEATRFVEMAKQYIEIEDVDIGDRTRRKYLSFGLRG